MEVKNFIMFTLGGIFLILLGAFLSPLIKSIPNFSEKLFFGETEANIHIIRTFPVYSNEELQTWDRIFMGVNAGQQAVVFQKTLVELPNKEFYLNFAIDTGPYPYNYLIYIQNNGNRTIENLKGSGQMRAETISILNVDSLIVMDPTKIGGLSPYVKNFRFEIPRLKKGETTSFRIASINLSDISLECISNSGKCNIGITENRVPVPAFLPIKVESSYKGKPIIISIPDYRNKKNGIYLYNPDKNIWVEFDNKEFEFEVRKI